MCKQFISFLMLELVSQFLEVNLKQFSVTGG